MNRPVEGWLAIAEPMNFQSKVDDQIDQWASIPRDICRDDFRFEPETKSISASNDLCLCSALSISPAAQSQHFHAIQINALSRSMTGDARSEFRRFHNICAADAALARRETSVFCTDDTAPELGLLSPPRVDRRNAAVFSGRCVLPIIAVGHAVLNVFSGPWTARCKSVMQVTGLA